MRGSAGGAICAGSGPFSRQARVQALACGETSWHEGESPRRVGRVGPHQLVSWRRARVKSVRTTLWPLPSGLPVATASMTSPCTTSPGHARPAASRPSRPARAQHTELRGDDHACGCAPAPRPRWLRIDWRPEPRSHPEEPHLPVRAGGACAEVVLQGRALEERAVEVAANGGCHLRRVHQRPVLALLYHVKVRLPVPRELAVLARRKPLQQAHARLSQAPGRGCCAGMHERQAWC